LRQKENTPVFDRHIRIHYDLINLLLAFQDYIINDGRSATAGVSARGKGWRHENQADTYDDEDGNEASWLHTRAQWGFVLIY
jgi:hypothetical protein